MNKTYIFILVFYLLSALNVEAEISDNTDRECPLSLTGEVKDVLCKNGSDGSIDLTITGSSITTFSWSNGMVDEDLTDLKPGIYTVTVSNNHCSITASFNVNEPDLLSLEITGKKDITCNNSSDGELAIAGSGGTQPFLFSINEGITYTSSEVFKDLREGTYEIIIKDRNNCTAFVGANINAPVQQKIDLGPNRSILSNNEYIIDAGNGYRNYLWNTGETTQIISINREVNETTIEEFFVTVTDNNGCNYLSEKLIITINPATHKNEEISIISDSVLFENKESEEEKIEDLQIDPITIETE